MSSKDLEAKSSSNEPSMKDLCDLIKNVATKDDIQEIKAQLNTHTAATASKIDAANARIEHIAAKTTQNTDKIEQLEASIEVLKQEQLRNNICVSGVPTNTIEGTNTAEIVIAIAKKLGVELSRQNFTSYPVAGNKFIIVNMYNVRHKQTLLNKIRVKKSLMVEEVLPTQSNSQIYLNDHLTPYFNRLFLIARNAKKEGKLASASSYGGKIRARKSLNDAPSVIYTEKQLQLLIADCDSNSSTSSVQHISDSESNEITPNIQNIKKPRNTQKPHNNNRQTSIKNKTKKRRKRREVSKPQLPTSTNNNKNSTKTEEYQQKSPAPTEHRSPADATHSTQTVPHKRISLN